MTLVLQHINRVYGEGKSAVHVLKDVSLQVNSGEFVAVVGPSGSGKSTFLSIAGALLAPTNGTMHLNGKEVTGLSDREAARLRLEELGFIFQAANLVPYLTVRDQLLLIAKLAGMPRRQAVVRSAELLAGLGLSHRVDSYPAQLSGGERQRVAIARAFMNDPQLILADEPTASLDSKRGRDVAEMLAQEVKERGKAAVMVTHDERILDLCDRVVMMKDGQLIEQ